MKKVLLILICSIFILTSCKDDEYIEYHIVNVEWCNINDMTVTCYDCHLGKEVIIPYDVRIFKVNFVDLYVCGIKNIHPCYTLSYHNGKYYG